MSEPPIGVVTRWCHPRWYRAGGSVRARTRRRKPLRHYRELVGPRVV